MEAVTVEWEKEKEFAAGQQKKLEQTQRQLEKERAEKESLENELLEAKRELTRTRIQREETTRNYEVLQSDYRLSQEKCKQWEDKICRFEVQLGELSSQLNSNRDENRRLREQVA